MPNYALVIGIDDYVPEDWKLNGAVYDALAFARWVTETGGVTPNNLRLLLSSAPNAALPPLPSGAVVHGPANSQNIIDAIADLQNLSQEQSGERLYFYYAGHGASLPHWRTEPILIPSDFADPQRHGSRLIGFDQVIPALTAAPFDEQIFLIDACRDFGLKDYKPPMQNAVGAYGTKEGPSQYVLYSVSPGQRAAEIGRGIWTTTLLEGLKERSYQVVTRRRGPDGKSRYEVRLDRLAEWVRVRVGERIEYTFLRDAARFVQMPQYDKDPRGGNPLLASFSAEEVPQVNVAVFIEPALAHQTCKVEVMQYVDGIGQEQRVGGSDAPPITSPLEFKLRPSDYSFRAQAERYVLQSKAWTVDDPPQVELTLEEDQSVVITPQPSPFRGLPQDLPGHPSFELPMDGGDGGAWDGSVSGGGAWDGNDRASNHPDVVMPLPDENDLDFSVPVEGLEAAVSLNPPATLTVTSPDRYVFIEVLNAHRETVHTSLGSFSDRPMEPGIYRVRMLLPGIQPIEQSVEVRAGRHTDLALNTPDPKLGSFQIRLLQDLGVEVAYERGGKAINYLSPSETLGPVSGARLASLLAFAAYAANHPTSMHFEKLRRFGVSPFVSDASCGLLTLVGIAGNRPEAELAGFLSDCRIVVRRLDGTVVDRGDFETLSGMTAAAQRQVALNEHTSLHVELRLPGFARTRYALTTLPGRITVFIAVVEDDGTVDVQQYLLPRFSGTGDVPSWNDYLRNDLGNIRRLDLAQRFYAAGNLEGLLPSDLGDLLLGKWLDPLLGCIAGYALVRAGNVARFVGELWPGALDILDHLDESDVIGDARTREPVESALRNLVTFFTELPDVHVLAALCTSDPERRASHFARALRYGVPIFAEGTRALADWLKLQSTPSGVAGTVGQEFGAPLPAALREPLTSLLTGSPWTAWAAVQPVLFVQAGRFEAPPPSWRKLEDHRPAIEASLGSVGRIEIEGDQAIPWVGTGFLVAPDLVMTASFNIMHLIQRPASVVPPGNRDSSAGPRDEMFRSWTISPFRPGIQLFIDFHEELAQTDLPAEFAITGVIAVDETLKLALLRVERTSRSGGYTLPPPLRLGRGAPMSGGLEGRSVYIVGYPAYDSRNDPTLIQRVLSNVYNVKRLQPGELLRVTPELHAFQHDCFTTSGNSGAPVIDVASGAVIGLHHSGQRGLYKEATSLWTLVDSDFFAGTAVEWLAW